MQSLTLVTTNRLLQAMSTDSRTRVAPYLEHVALPLGTVLCEPGCGWITCISRSTASSR